MAKKAKKKVRKTPLQKIQAGEEWRLQVVIEPDIAPQLVTEQEEKLGAELGKIINQRLREAYKIK